MSQENVENLRAFLEEVSGPIAPALAAWKRGEALSLLDPEVTYEDTALPDHAGETYRGHEGVIRATERWAEPYEELTVELGTSSARVTNSSPSTTSGRRRGTPESSSRHRWPTSGYSETERSLTSSRLSGHRKPSKPPGCGSGHAPALREKEKRSLTRMEPCHRPAASLLLLVHSAWVASLTKTPAFNARAEARVSASVPGRPPVESDQRAGDHPLSSPRL
jgi:hypothetical protein